MKLCASCGKNEAIEGNILCIDCYNDNISLPKRDEVKEVKEVKDQYAWNLLMFYIEIDFQQDDITERLYDSLNDALQRFKPEIEPRC